MEDSLVPVQVVLDGQYGIVCRRSAPSLPHRSAGLQIDLSNMQPQWLVLSEPNRLPLSTRVPRARRVLIIGEPSPLAVWPSQYVNQFGVILSPYRISSHNGHWIESHPGLPWIFGWDRRQQTVMSYQELVEFEVPKKQEAVSVVVSRKVVQAGHRRRLQFLDKLSGRLGNQLQIFGKGIREIDDKKDAIAPYCYHLALENTSEPNYWSEKLADAYLGYALPLYSGCPNIGNWFGDDSLIHLDLNDLGRAIAQVENVLESRLYQQYLPAIQEARRRILVRENLFEVVARAINQCPTVPFVPVDEIVEPMPKSSWPLRLRREAHRVYRQVTSKIPRVA